MLSRSKKNSEKIKAIENETKKEKRKKVLAIIIKILLILIIIVGIIYVSLRYIGNLGIIVKEEVVTSSILPDSFHGLKIVQFTDLHYGTSVKEKKLRKLVDEVNKLKPDIIVFTGDLVDRHSTITNHEQDIIASCLKDMKANLGKYAVKGNHDRKYFDSIMQNTDFKVLNNEYELIYMNGYDPILLVGLGSRNLKERNIDQAFEYFNTENHKDDIFTITILHEPDDIDKILSSYKTDLALAGHSHNGQIRLPFLEAMIKVNGAKKYYEAYYKINNTDLYISGGVGCSKYPFRLFNHPSINFIRLRKK